MFMWLLKTIFIDGLKGLASLTAFLIAFALVMAVTLVGVTAVGLVVSFVSGWIAMGIITTFVEAMMIGMYFTMVCVIIAAIIISIYEYITNLKYKYILSRRSNF